MRLLWENSARAELREILDYIASRNPTSAERLEEMLERTLEFLTLNPFMYRPGRVRSTREAVVHPNYIIVYRVVDDLITILAVLHSRQNYP